MITTVLPSFTLSNRNTMPFLSVYGFDTALLSYFRYDLSVCAPGTLHYDDNEREMEGRERRKLWRYLINGLNIGTLQQKLGEAIYERCYVVDRTTRREEKEREGWVD